MLTDSHAVPPKEHAAATDTNTPTTPPPPLPPQASHSEAAAKAAASSPGASKGQREGLPAVRQTPAAKDRVVPLSAPGAAGPAAGARQSARQTIEGGGGGAAAKAGTARKSSPSGHHNNYSPSAPPSGASAGTSPRTVRPLGTTTQVSSSATPPTIPRRPDGPPAAATVTSPLRQKKMSVSAGAGGAATSGGKVPAPRQFRAPLTKKQLKLLRLLQHEEEAARLALESTEAGDFTALAVSIQQSLLKHVNEHVESSGRILADLQGSTVRQDATNVQAHALSSSILQTVTLTSSVLRAFVDYHSSAERDRLHRLEVENAALKRELGDKDAELVRQFAEIEGLRDTLSRLIIRSDVENDVLRRSVEAQIAQNATDVAAMRQVLQARIDATVLAINKPAFASALQSLQDIVAEEQFKVQAQADELRYLVDQIGASNRFMAREDMSDRQRVADAAEAEGVAARDYRVPSGSSAGGPPLPPPRALRPSSSMHTNFPRLYREHLGCLSRHDLLRVLDIVSFEPRVVSCVGHALAEISGERSYKSMREVLMREAELLQEDEEEEAAAAAAAAEERLLLQGGEGVRGREGEREGRDGERHSRPERGQRQSQDTAEAEPGTGESGCPILDYPQGYEALPPPPPYRGDAVAFDL